MKGKNVDRSGKWSFTIIVIVIFSIIGLLLLLVDNFVAIVYAPLQDISRITINTIATIAGFWITCYLLFLELFKDRYPMEMLKEKQLPRMRNHFALLLCDIIYGCIVALFDYPFLSCIWFIMSSIATTVIVFIEVYHANKTLMVNTYIDNFFKKISKDFDESEFTISASALKQIHFIFEESLIKEEYYTSRNIAKKTGKTFRAFLKHSLELSVSAGPDEAENAFDQIVAFNMSQLELCKNIKSELVLDTLVREQKENIAFCIDHKGFCIEYDFSVPCKERSDLLVLPVVYSRERPKFPWSVALAADKKSDVVKSDGARAMIRSLVTKDDAWQYEDEWRIITLQSAGIESVKMPPISCIYIGALCPEAHRAMLIEIAQTHNIPVKQMTIDRGEYTLRTSNVSYP